MDIMMLVNYNVNVKNKQIFKNAITHATLALVLKSIIV